MRTLAALVTAFPLLAAAQGAPPAQSWTTDPPTAAPAPQTAPAPAPAPAAQPAPAPAPPAYAPPPQQYAPPPQYPPQPQAVPAKPPPAAPAYARPMNHRDTWYIGFGFGGGNGKVANADSTASFKEASVAAPTTLFFNFKVGATLSPKLLLGLDVGAIASAATDGTTTSSLSISNVDVMLTYFPSERGFFLKGGLGRSAVSYAVDSSALGITTNTATGLNVAGGLGYAWWLGKQFNLTANLDVSRQWYGGTSTTGGPFLLDEIKDSQFWSLWLGFDWY
jgi:hypothetical protein